MPLASQPLQSLEVREAGGALVKPYPPMISCGAVTPLRQRVGRSIKSGQPPASSLHTIHTTPLTYLTYLTEDGATGSGLPYLPYLTRRQPRVFREHGAPAEEEPRRRRARPSMDSLNNQGCVSARCLGAVTWWVGGGPGCLPLPDSPLTSDVIDGRVLTLGMPSVRPASS